MTKEQIAAWSDQADEHSDKTLQCKGEFHPDWHEVRDAYFAKLVRNAALEEAAVKCDELMAPEEFNRTEKTVWDVATLDCGAAIRNLKEPTP